jgi:hypothetical protein
MNDKGDLPNASAEESGLSTNHNWEGEGINLLSEIALNEGDPIQTICYAGCGNDSTPSSHISSAVVTYIDPNHESTKDLKVRPQDHFYQQKLEDFVAEHPDQVFDMVYLLNSYAPDDESIGVARSGGKIIVNNYLGHATNFASPKWSDKGLKLIGVLAHDGSTIRYETERPEESLVRVQSELELEAYVKNCDSELLKFYEVTRSVAIPSVIISIFQQLEFPLKEDEDLVDAYIRLYDELSNQQKKELQGLGVPEGLDIPITIENSRGQTIELPDLPPKMANVVLWVFEKNPQKTVTQLK